MSGLTDEQWNEVEKRLVSIDGIAGVAANINSELKDMITAIDKIQIEVAVINTELFGKSGNNGIKGSIKELKGKTSSTMSKWIPIIICVLMFAATTYGWIKEGIISNIKQTQVVAPAQPTP